MGTGALDISAVELQVLQKEDPSVANLKVGAGELQETHYYRSEGLLYRQWIPRGCNAELAVDQLVLPTQCRKAVLQLAHEVPIAGHLGKHKTAKRILRRFYWPTLYKDVEDFCRSCQVCQKYSKQKVVMAPFIPLPVVTEPFRRVAMDIVGPLPRTKTGNRYILVMCDYATRCPEAVPVKAVDAEHIAEELVRIFARVGIPEEMLTDQGSNFTSQLLSEIYQLLHVHPIRTSPYHPQTDGLVERFNITLKAMLRKVAAEDELNWDKWLPYLLFAYREVPQDSTGFSPFELLYGRAVRGPLDILKESWKEPKKGSDKRGVLCVGCTAEKAEGLVRSECTPEGIQAWRPCAGATSYFSGVSDCTMAGAVSSASQIGSVNYLVDMHDTRKRERTFHVNMLKKWNTQTYGNYWAEADGEDWTEEEEEIPEWRGGGEGDSKVRDQLSEAQRGQLEELLTEFGDVISNNPGRTAVVEHQVTTTGTRPVRLSPYRLPHAYRDLVHKEVQEMLDAGIIEPSSSEWASPIVLVNKKDGTLRLCIDYRRLNAESQMDAYPMPRIDDLTDRLGKAMFLTTLDLMRGYWQVPMASTSRHLTAFTTPFGLFLSLK
ncbi:hypothetical protein EMCRGX_G002203 [Ephydatia muelleri]